MSKVVILELSPHELEFLRGLVGLLPDLPASWMEWRGLDPSAIPGLEAKLASMGPDHGPYCHQCRAVSGATAQETVLVYCSLPAGHAWHCEYNRRID